MVQTKVDIQDLKGKEYEIRYNHQGELFWLAFDASRKTQTSTMLGQYILTNESAPANFSFEASNTSTTDIEVKCNSGFYVGRKTSELSPISTPSIMTFVRDSNYPDSIIIASKAHPSDVLIAVHKDIRQTPPVLRMSFQSGIDSNIGKHLFHLVESNH